MKDASSLEKPHLRRVLVFIFEAAEKVVRRALNLTPGVLHPPLGILGRHSSELGEVGCFCELLLALEFSLGCLLCKLSGSFGPSAGCRGMPAS